MKQELIQIGGHHIPLYSCHTAVVGSGAAGLNAVARLFSFGVTDCVLVTENQMGGTSRNTGSDKQTYYKLSLSGKEPDSVYAMAKTLFAGGCMDGDIALCEAALSTKCFMRLVELGVPFPRDRYGEFVGYKTDHDPSCRATSVGPYTSRMMTEKLEVEVKGLLIPIFNKHQVIRILQQDNHVSGLLCLARDSGHPHYALFQCQNIVYATGGPAAMYAESVYPSQQFGASGLAFEAGAKGRNLTEWQYGLASVRPRWNVSGTYMQVMPKFISTAADGSDAREFLMDFFQSREEMLTKVFFKGYQWPFDVRRVDGQSSIVDILVYLEKQKGRRIYLDFRENPGNADIDYSRLDPEAYAYLEKAGACFGTPLERLSHMNQPAVDFYRDHGVDLARMPLEISLCAQHNNGGLAVDLWWRTNVSGLFAVGEVAGTHGVYRPGGTALNAGQVGSERAATYIAMQHSPSRGDRADFLQHCAASISEMLELGDQSVRSGKAETARCFLQKYAQMMSQVAGPFRKKERLIAFRERVSDLLESFQKDVYVSRPEDLGWVFRLRDVLLSQYVYVSAMIDYIDQGGKSRGSALYTDPNGKVPSAGLAEDFRFSKDDGAKADVIQEAQFKAGSCTFDWRKVHPLPEDDLFFENVWRMYRENQNVW